MAFSFPYPIHVLLSGGARCNSPKIRGRQLEAHNSRWSFQSFQRRTVTATIGSLTSTRTTPTKLDRIQVTQEYENRSSLFGPTTRGKNFGKCSSTTWETFFLIIPIFATGFFLKMYVCQRLTTWMSASRGTIYSASYHFFAPALSLFIAQNLRWSLWEGSAFLVGIILTMLVIYVTHVQLWHLYWGRRRAHSSTTLPLGAKSGSFFLQKSFSMSWEVFFVVRHEFYR